jgi:hypothetical protein
VARVTHYAFHCEGTISAISHGSSDGNVFVDSLDHHIQPSAIAIEIYPVNPRNSNSLGARDVSGGIPCRPVQS